jgi:hypothetical protein
MDKRIIENKPENKVEDIKNICKIYKEMTYDGHKPKEGLEKARCMLFAHKYYYEEIKNRK